MYKIIRCKKAQSLIEYAVLLVLIISALLLMSAYVKRAYSGRMKQDADQIGAQYAPRHTTSRIETTAQSRTESCTGGKCRGIDVPEGVTVTWTDDALTQYERKEAIDSFAAP